MNSDDYFDGEDSFDCAAFEQLDAIEAAHFSPSKRKPATTTTTERLPLTSPIVPAKPSSGKLGHESSFYDLSLDIDETDYAQLDAFIVDSYQGKAKPIAGPSKPARTSSSNKLQTTLFGDILRTAPTPSSSKPKPQLERTKSGPRNLFGQQAQKTKQWDQTQFAKTGIRKSKSVKGKGREDDDDDEPEEFEQFPAPFVSLGPPPPMKVEADLLEAKHWIFPLNRPKRDYQFNIVKNALFENTLVALPTGLGKTFIAGVVMLNYYRWFPEGKVVFVAPTKPLVSQQITACHETCGIPGRDAIELNGETPVHARRRYWKEKRVFYMTPQTLVNDLTGENCDVSDIVLLVVDEAHHASGDYAYNQVIRFLMAKNPHFRVLALTATPGNNVETIQTLVDGLHISHIEIRNEESLDLKAYIHKKIFKAHIIMPDENLGKLRDLLVKTMEPIMKSLNGPGLFYPGDNPIKMHPYRAQALMSQKQNGKHFGPLSMLGKLARVMLYLVAGSYRACYTYIDELMHDREDEGGEGSKKKKGGNNKKLRDNPQFCAFVKEFELQRARGFTVYPKIEKLKNILIQHFGSRIPEEGAEDDTKVMIFSSYRSVVDEIVEELEKERPLIRATRFIGQGTDKQGKKGLAQKEQLEVIKKFKSGEYNVLVATSIGEEGLDIGELDMTICYDADKAPTRMIQRFGRTGRKREGTIHALLAEQREENNIELAEAKYKEMQVFVNNGKMYELYSDVKRLLPDHITPQCVEKVVEIEEYVREERKRKASPTEKGTKRKRNDKIDRNIPEGASTGFVSVRDLVVKGTKKPKKSAVPKNLDPLDGSDEEDEDIESGRIIPVRRTQSEAADTKTKKKASTSKLKKSATLATSKVQKPRKKKEPEKELTLSQLSQLGVDDSDDMDIESGIVLPSLKSQLEASLRQPSRAMSLTPEPSPVKRPQKFVNQSVIELSDSDHDHSAPVNQDKGPSPSMLDFNMEDDAPQDQDMSWLVDDDDDERQDFQIVDSSPLAPKRRSPVTFERVQIADESMEISNLRRFDEDVIPTPDPLENPPDDSIEFVEPGPSNKDKGRATQAVLPTTKFRPASSLFSPSRKSNSLESGASHWESSPAWKRPNSPPIYQGKGKGKIAMLPPALPQRLQDYPGAVDMPEPSFPIARAPKRRRIILDEPESPNFDLEMPPPSQRRLHRIESTPVRNKPQRKDRNERHRTKPSILPHKGMVNPLFDAEAAHSGDEVSEGYSDEDEESESDRQFIKDSPATQASQSYDQSLVYRQSLLTQAPAGMDFGNRPVRARPFGRIDGAIGRRGGQGFLPSSSPPPPDDDLDHYHLDSFVVDDDEEISYEV